MGVIQTVTARSILDSKGTPTVETTITLSDNHAVTASVPSGTSVGKFEAHELRDGDEHHFEGKGVTRAVSNIIDKISPALIGKDPTNQEELDSLLCEIDGTPEKKHLGANAILSVSIAVAKAGASSNQVPLYRHIAGLFENEHPKLPHILSNLINGGLHAGKNLDIQEFLVIPSSAPTITLALEQLTHINSLLKKTLVSRGFQPLIGDEGGFAPQLRSNEEALSTLSEVIREAGFTLGDEVLLGMDAAAGSFYESGQYKLKDSSSPLSGEELGNLYKNFQEKFHLKYLEDPFAEDDIESWESFAKICPQSLVTTGDDLTVTNPDKLDQALENKVISGIIIKPNQIGTITETLRVVRKARDAGLMITVSHRSGETNDDFIADIAVGVSADLAKFGAPVRGERVAKYNRLLQIEQELSK